LEWLNREYIKKMPPAELLEIVSAKMPNISPDVLKRALPSITDHISVFGDIDTLAKNGEFDYLSDKINYPKEKLFWKGESDSAKTIKHLKYILEILKKLPPNPTSEQAKSALWDYATTNGRGQVLWPLRYALSGQDKSPDPFVLISILGNETTTERIGTAIKKLSL
jgi:glutamyl/glutaminyl-tRNA synthetase